MLSGWLWVARSSDKFPFPCPPAFIYTWKHRDGYFNVYIKTRPNVGVLFGDTWHRNKSLRRARKKHVLLTGSFGLLRATQPSKTQLLNKQAGRWMQIKPDGQKGHALFSCGFDRGFEACLGSSWRGFSTTLKASSGERACSKESRKEGWFLCSPGLRGWTRTAALGDPVEEAAMEVVEERT